MLALKELLHNLKYRNWDVNPTYKIDENEARKIIQALDETDKKIADYIYMIGLLQDRIEEIEKSDKWIPISERLQGTDEDVLITNGIGINIGWIDADDHKWRLNGDYIIDSVLAWMPLPEPMKVGE
jgi:hypothetical protein